jgi:hypothetical protein
VPSTERPSRRAALAAFGQRHRREHDQALLQVHALVFPRVEDLRAVGRGPLGVAGGLAVGGSHGGVDAGGDARGLVACGQRGAQARGDDPDEGSHGVS